MSHATVIHLFSCLCPWLMLVWWLQWLAGRCGFRKRGWVRLLVPGLVAAGILAVRVDGVSLLGWVIGLNANFSIPFTGLVAAAVWEGAFPQSLFAGRDWSAGWAFGLLAGALLYPLALGWGRLDPYGWGWHFSALFVAGAAISAGLLWRQNRFGLLLLLAISAYHLRLLESTNYWDYLVDPVYCLVSIPALVRRLVPRKMNVEFQRQVDSTLGPLICALLSFVDRFRGKPVAARPPRRILVILLSELGSLVLAQAMFARLKQQYPGASIHALVFARNREVLDLMGLIPKTNVLTLDDRSMAGFFGGGFRTLFILRGLRFDVVIDCELFARISSILSYLTGAPVRIGFHPHTQEGLYRGSFINRPVLYNPYRHISQQFLTLAAAIESDTVPLGKDASAWLPRPPSRLGFSDEQVRQVAEQLHTDFPPVKGRKLVLVYPSGGILPIRAWPREHYFQLCTALLAEGYAVGIIGLPSDKPLAQTIVAHCRDDGCIDLAGYTKSIQHLLTLFHRASLVITNDGGPGQLAALTPVPVIVLFGPETPALYRPLAEQAHCFHLSLPCSPCLTAYNHRTSPCDGDNQCLKRIMPEQVLAKAREILGPMQSAERAGPR
jgi:lipopolysaccharide heptosyltransferase II